MNSKEVYMNTFQVLMDRVVAYPTDFDRELVVHVSRASAGNISHITMEFAGMRSKFFSCIMFDGSGDMGCGITSYAMPKSKVMVDKRALLCLTMLEYLIDTGVLKADFEYFKERISHEIQGGASDILQRYEVLSRNSRNYIKSKEAELSRDVAVSA
jgi:hypothetical protein